MNKMLNSSVKPLWNIVSSFWDWSWLWSQCIWGSFSFSYKPSENPSYPSCFISSSLEIHHEWTEKNDLIAHSAIFFTIRCKRKRRNIVIKKHPNKSATSSKVWLVCDLLASLIRPRSRYDLNQQKQHNSKNKPQKCNVFTVDYSIMHS